MYLGVIFCEITDHYCHYHTSSRIAHYVYGNSQNTTRPDPTRKVSLSRRKERPKPRLRRRFSFRSDPVGFFGIAVLKYSNPFKVDIHSQKLCQYSSRQPTVTSVFLSFCYQ